MISVPTRRVKQVGVEFYQAGLSAKDIDRLVKFEVLGYTGGPQNEPAKKSRTNRSRVNWDSLEKRIGESETAYQRPVIRARSTSWWPTTVNARMPRPCRRSRAPS